MYLKTNFGAEIFFSNELRNSPEELLKMIAESLVSLKNDFVTNILVILDEPDPKLKPIDHMQIGDMLSEHLVSGSKVAIYSKTYVESVESVFTEVIIHGRGTPIKYFNSKSEALSWFETD